MSIPVEPTLIVGLLIIAAWVGVAVYYEYIKKAEGTPFSYIVTIGVVSTCVITPLVFGAVAERSRTATAQATEFWNGLEKSTHISVTKCERDGVCRHEYNCDPYLDVETYIDNKGKMKYRRVWKHHSCPYGDREVSYVISDTLGDNHVVAASIYPPDVKPWRAGVRLPDGVSREIPQLWTEAKGRIDSGHPGGVTKQNTYNNWVQSVQETVVARYSDKVEQFAEEGLLPTPQNEIYQIYKADKTYFVGFDGEIPNAAVWNEELARFNGVLGHELQGDLHVVFVNGDKVTDADGYSQALNAYWLDRSREDSKGTLSKNGLVLVMGVDPAFMLNPVKVGAQPSESGTGSALDAAKKMAGAQTVGVPPVANGAVGIQGAGDTTSQSGADTVAHPIRWSRAFTGMPHGNEVLAATVSSPIFAEKVQGVLHDPVVFYSAQNYPYEVMTRQYNRVSMKDYEYLKNDIPLSVWAIAKAAFASVVLSLMTAFFAGVVYDKIEEGRERARVEAKYRR